MSEENVEIVRRVCDAWNDRELESLLALADPAVEYVNSPTAVEPGTRYGHDGLAAVVTTQWKFFSDARAEIRRIHDRGEEIVVLAQISRRMPGSDSSIQTESLTAWTIHDAKVVRAEMLGAGPEEVRDALEAAGLEA